MRYKSSSGGAPTLNAESAQPKPSPTMTIKDKMLALLNLAPDAGLFMRLDGTWYMHLPNVWKECDGGAKVSVYQEAMSPQHAIVECFAQITQGIVLVNRYNAVFTKRFRWEAGKWQRIWDKSELTERYKL